MRNDPGLVLAILQKAGLLDAFQPDACCNTECRKQVSSKQPVPEEMAAVQMDECDTITTLQYLQIAIT